MVSSRLAGDAVGVGVEEAQPAQAFDAGERVEQRGKAVFEAEVFAVAGGVLADEGDFLDAAGDELLGFGDDGLEAAGAEFAAQVGDDAEGAGVVAALGDFDVGRGFGRGQEARGGFVVEIGGQQVGCALPGVAAEAALLFAVVAFGRGKCVLVICGCRRGIPGRDGFRLAAGEDVEGRSGRRRREERPRRPESLPARRCRLRRPLRGCSCGFRRGSARPGSRRR